MELFKSCFSLNMSYDLIISGVEITIRNVHLPSVGFLTFRYTVVLWQKRPQQKPFHGESFNQQNSVRGQIKY